MKISFDFRRATSSGLRLAPLQTRCQPAEVSCLLEGSYSRQRLLAVIDLSGQPLKPDQARSRCQVSVSILMIKQMPWKGLCKRTELTPSSPRCAQPAEEGLEELPWPSQEQEAEPGSYCTYHDCPRGQEDRRDACSSSSRCCSSPSPY